VITYLIPTVNEHIYYVNSQMCVRSGKG